jgi:hypothetical protein
VCTIKHDAVHLEEPEDVKQWQQLVMSKLQSALGSRKTYILVDYNGFTVNPLMADAYGKVAEEIRRRFAKDVFRYGAKDPLSAASARLQSIKRAHKSNIFATRDEALAALSKARGLR